MAPPSLIETVSNNGSSVQFKSFTNIRNAGTYWYKIVEEGLSVRQTEKLVAELGKGPKKKPVQKQKNPDTVRVEEELKSILGTRVNIVEKGKKGKIEIECFSRDEMNRLIELLKKLG